MQNLQDIFNHIQKVQKEQKKLRTVYRDALRNSGEYKKLFEDMAEMREKKKTVENNIKQDSVDEMRKLEELKNDLQTEMEMLSDVALSKMMKGESLELRDENDNKYEPVVNIRFKKVY